VCLVQRPLTSIDNPKKVGDCIDKLCPMLQIIRRASSNRAKNRLGLMLKSDIFALWILDDACERQQSVEQFVGILKNFIHIQVSRAPKELKLKHDRMLKLAASVLRTIGRPEFVRNVLPQQLSPYMEGFPYTKNFEFIITQAMH
jgi:hypothetical protein